MKLPRGLHHCFATASGKQVKPGGTLCMRKIQHVRQQWTVSHTFEWTNEEGRKTEDIWVEAKHITAEYSIAYNNKRNEAKTAKQIFKIYKYIVPLTVITEKPVEAFLFHQWHFRNKKKEQLLYIKNHRFYL